MPDFFADAPIPIAAQIKEVERELAMREHVYPRRVTEGKLRQDVAERNIRAMRAVLETLKELERRG